MPEPGTAVSTMGMHLDPLVCIVLMGTYVYQPFWRALLVEIHIHIIPYTSPQHSWAPIFSSGRAIFKKSKHCPLSNMELTRKSILQRQSVLFSPIPPSESHVAPVPGGILGTSPPIDFRSGRAQVLRGALASGGLR